MIEDPAIRKAREDVLAAPADRHGCIRIRRSDILGLLDVIAALDEALDRNEPTRRPQRFLDRLHARGPAPKPAKVRR